MIHPSSETVNRLWMNGEWIDADFSLIHDFCHDTPTPLPEPFNEQTREEWLALLSFSDEGGSAWSHSFIRSLLQIRICVCLSFEAMLGVKRLDSPDLPPFSIQDFQSILKSLDQMMSLARRSYLCCWAFQPSRIELIYSQSLDLPFSDLPHLSREKSLMDDDSRSLTKIANRSEAGFNKWLKSKTS